MKRPECLDSFNPRPCARGDIKQAYFLFHASFQSTPLREGRPSNYLSKSGYFGSFNPRPCARGDPYNILIFINSKSFNPRPCARGDLRCDVIIKHNDMFQSTPLREGRPLMDEAS